MILGKLSEILDYILYTDIIIVKKNSSLLDMDILLNKNQTANKDTSKLKVLRSWALDSYCSAYKACER